MTMIRDNLTELEAIAALAADKGHPGILPLATTSRQPGNWLATASASTCITPTR